MTLTYDDGTQSTLVADIGATSRLTLDLGSVIPASLGRSFRIEVQSVGGSLPLVAERAIYRSTAERQWASGSVIVGRPVF